MYSEETTVDYKKSLKTIITEYTYCFYLLQNTEEASSSSPKGSRKWKQSAFWMVLCFDNISNSSHFLFCLAASPFYSGTSGA